MRSAAASERLALRSVKEERAEDRAVSGARRFPARRSESSRRLDDRRGTPAISSLNSKRVQRALGKADLLAAKAHRLGPSWFDHGKHPARRSPIKPIRLLESGDTAGQDQHWTWGIAHKLRRDSAERRPADRPMATRPDQQEVRALLGLADELLDGRTLEDGCRGTNVSREDLDRRAQGSLQCLARGRHDRRHGPVAGRQSGREQLVAVMR